jgi:hypothetical protein
MMTNRATLLFCFCLGLSYAAMASAEPKNSSTVNSIANNTSLNDAKLRQTHQNTTIKIAAPHITNLIEENGSGIYQRVMNEALEENPFEVKQIFSPYKRALILFERKDTDCIYSLTQVMKDKFGENSINYSFPLGAFAYFMFTPQNQPTLTDPSQLESLQVGAVYGHDTYYKHRLSEHTNLIMVSDDLQNVKKLSLNRLDVMIGALPDLLPYITRFNFSADHPLVESFDRITCHKNEKTELFLDALSSSLKKLKLNGSYEKIAGPLYFDFSENDTSKTKHFVNP